MGNREAALVLVQNERTANEAYEHWKDITGEQYHLPNQYKNRMVPGTPFVYYRGTRRTGGRRGTPEYFGCGIVGALWRDPKVPHREPKRKWAWFCQIEDYVPFRWPVPAKSNGRHIETIPQNFWGVAVRQLPEHAYRQILDLAGLSKFAKTKQATSTILPPISDVKASTQVVRRSLLVPQAASRVGEGKRGSSTKRHAKHTKLIGDRAEEIAFRYLADRAEEDNSMGIRWMAREGETPGWDIQYVDANSKIVAIEVKGTSATAFTSVELTGNEWDAARRLGDQYKLFLVADCLGVSPKIEVITNPAALADERGFEITPVRWRLTRSR